MTIGALSLVSTMAMAQNSIYAGGGLSMDMVDIDGLKDFDNGISAELLVGITMENNFGGEVKFENTITAAEINSGGESFELETTIISFYGTYAFPATPELTIMPKIGYANMKTETDYSYYRGNTNADESDTGLVFGVDFKYNISPLGRIYAGYTIFNVDNGDFSKLAVGYQHSF